MGLRLHILAQVFLLKGQSTVGCVCQCHGRAQVQSAEGGTGAGGAAQGSAGAEQGMAPHAEGAGMVSGEDEGESEAETAGEMTRLLSPMDRGFGGGQHG
jgi:hypothetical protein